MHRSQGVLQGATQELRKGEEEGRARVVVHLQGPVHHRPCRLAKGPGNSQKLDEALVRSQARTSAHLPKSESKSKF